MQYPASRIGFDSPTDMQLAADGKIYIIPSQEEFRRLDTTYTDTLVGCRFLSVIHCPEERGAACRFELRGQDLGGRYSGLLLPLLNQTLVRNAGRLVAVAQPGRLCGGDTARLSAAGGQVSRLRWRQAAGPGQLRFWPSDTAGLPRVTASAPGRYTVAVHGMGGCQARDTSLTLEFVQPAALGRADTLLCADAAGGALPLSAGVERSQTLYRWQVADGRGPLFSVGLLDSLRLGAQVQLSNLDTVAHRVVLVLTAQDRQLGCASLDTVTVTVGPRLNIYSAGPDLELCQGASTVAGLAAPRSFAYSWQATSTGRMPELENPQGSETLVHALDTAATQEQRVAIIRTVSADGCQARDTVLLTLHPKPARVLLSGPGWVCPGSQRVAYAVRPDAAGGGATVGVFQVRVGVEGGDSVALLRQGGPAGYPQELLVAWQAQPTDGAAITLHLSTDKGCKADSARLAVSVTRRLHPRFALTSGYNTALCLEPGRMLAYKALDTLTGRSYGWRIEGGLPDTAGGTSALTAFSQPGPHRICLFEREQTPAAACAGDTVLEAFIYPLPAPARLAGPDTLCVDVPAIITVSLDSANWRWTADGLGPVALSLEQSGLTLTGTAAEQAAALSVQTRNAFGCAGPVVTKALYVRSLPMPVLPNLITPNGDGSNDTLWSADLRFRPGCRLEVYDSWGRRVFVQDNYAGGFTGQGLPAGTYLYSLSQPALGVRKGWIEIVR